jgi:ubiquinone/menaquinone biosynthesis C-methylase UbiE
VKKFRPLLFFLSAVSILAVSYVAYSALDTLRSLEAIESDRDRWQRADIVIDALDLQRGDVVADVGCGSGYFALKLSPLVRQVLAVDIRRLSLSFLWMRAISRGDRNIRVILAEEDDPRLPAQAVDAVLVANTYHEFRNPRAILNHIRRSLRPGGVLVIVDRGPRPGEETVHTHELPFDAVRTQVQEAGFEVMREENSFIDNRGEDLWWLLGARKR